MYKILVVLGVSLPLAFAQSGTVTSGGQPIPGVIVQATMGERALTTATDERGAFQFTGMAPGTWSVEANMFGFDPLKRDVTIGTDPVKIDLTLQLQARVQVAPRGGGRGNQNQDSGLVADLPPEAPPQLPGGGDTSNEAFTIAGTVSSGLATTNGDFGPPGGFGGPGAFGAGPGGPGGPGGANGLGQPGGPGGPGGAGGAGGGGRNAGGGGGGAAGFGGAGGGGGGGRGGGGGGRGGRGGQQARGLIGNRSRQGANQIRINVFDTITNSAFNAKSYSITGADQNKPEITSNRYGINIGGPVTIGHWLDLSKHLNFTVNYNGTIQDSGSSQFATVPTLAERMGNFQGVTTGSGANVTPVTIYDPLSGGTTPFPNNTIPQSRLNPVALALLPFIPLPNQTTPNNQQNYNFALAEPNNSQQVTAQVQYTIRPADRMSIQIRTQSTDSKAAEGSFVTTAGGIPVDARSGFGQNQSVAWTHNFSTRLFNTLTTTLNRNAASSTPYFQTLEQTLGSSAPSFGIAGQWPNPSNYGPAQLNFTNFGSLLNDGNPTRSAVQTMTLQDQLSVRRGKHNMSFGGNFVRYDTNLLTDSNGRGTFQFNGSQTAEAGAVSTGTGYDFADFLLGLPESASVVYGADRYYRGISYSAFANDDFRFLPNLSLQLGVRYEYTSPLSEKYGREANLETSPDYTGAIGSGSAIVAAANCTGALEPCTVVPGTPSAMVKPDRLAIEPRLGLAWQAMKRGSLLIRAGFGTYYNEGIYNQVIGGTSGATSGLAYQQPFLYNSGTIETSTTNVLGLATGLTQEAGGKTITNTAAYDPTYKIPYSQTWNLGIQRNLPNQLVLQINYIGIKGTHLVVGLDPNQALPGPANTAAARLPITDANTFTYYETAGNLISNSGQVSLQRRMRNNLGFQLSYTRAKSIDDASTNVLNPMCIECERALSTNDRRDVVSFTLTAESPVDQRKGFLANKGALTQTLKNWTLQLPVSWSTGLPLTATVNGDVSGIGRTNGERAEATGLPITSGSGFFNTSAFTLPTAGTFGNVGRDTIPGPDSFTMNANMSRTFTLKERKTLEIQINSVNILNHPVPSAFGTTVGSNTFGVLTGVGGMRTISGTIRFRM